jgi:hypothetical protein
LARSGVRRADQLECSPVEADLAQIADALEAYEDFEDGVKLLGAAEQGPVGESFQGLGR